MNRIKRPAITIFLVLAALYFSLDIHSLDSARSRPAAEVFDVEVFVSDIWENHLPGVIENAMDAGELLHLIRLQPDLAFETHGHKLGISNTWYFMTRGEGALVKLTEESATIHLNDDTTVELAMLYLFGNAIRDGSGLVDISDFLNMMDFNLVSVQLNRKARTLVVDPFLQLAQPGQRVAFAGAFEIDRNNPDFNKMTIIPVQIKILEE